MNPRISSTRYFECESLCEMAVVYAAAVVVAARKRPVSAARARISVLGGFDTLHRAAATKSV